jgi:hypothetical protein
MKIGRTCRIPYAIAYEAKPLEFDRANLAHCKVVCKQRPYQLGGQTHRSRIPVDYL